MAARARTRARSIPMELPVELLEGVFVHLPSRDLDTVQLVCKQWRAIAGDRIWRRLFDRQFGTLYISSLSRRSSLWRSEFLLRQEVVNRWRKCVKQTDITVNSGLLDVTHCFVNFQSESFRAMCFNAFKGVGNVVDLQNGKIRRKLNISRHREEDLAAAALDMSRFAVFYGFYDGRVALAILSKDGTLVAEYKTPKYRHTQSVCAVWLAKTRNVGKQVRNAVSYASASLNGDVMLAYDGKHVSVTPSESPVLLMEGTMYGTGADGDILVTVHSNGDIYCIKYDESESFSVKLLTKLPFSLYRAPSGVELLLANMYVILRAGDRIFVVDIDSCTQFELAVPAEITAFAIDRAFSPGIRYLTAGLSTGDVAIWALPGAESERKVEIDPINVIYDAAHKAPGPNQDRKITQIAVNAAIVLVAGFNGFVAAFDVVSGHFLKQINSRIPKNVLDYSQYSSNGFVPVTNLQIDPDPLRLRGICVIRPALQSFDLGHVSERKDSKEPKKERRREPKNLHVNMHDELREELELHERVEYEDLVAQTRDESLREDFALDLDDEDQVAYALMLSQNEPQNQNETPYESEDAELARALELSRLEEPDDELARAIAMSRSEEDDLALAIEMSRSIR